MTDLERILLESVIMLTHEETQAIADLRSLAERWPKTLWLFAGPSGEGELCVMRCGADGKRVETSLGFVDQDYCVGSVSIPCDGGDF